MKKIMLIMAGAMCSLAMDAQVWVGGSVGFNYSKNDDGAKTTTFSLAPAIGYELNEKLEIGGELSYGYSKAKSTIKNVSTYTISEYNSNVKRNAFGIEPFVRYNFFKAGIVTLFVDGGLGYSFSKINHDYATKSGTSFDQLNFSYSSTTRTEESKTHEFSIGVRPGIKIELTEHLGLESHIGFLGYTHTSEKKFNSAETEEKKVSSDSFGLNANATALNIGLIWKF